MKKRKKKDVKDLLKSVKTLTVIFILLLIFVIFLVVLCVIKYKESKSKEFANMVIPIYETNTNYEFNINAKILNEVDGYTFKIVNYRKDKINEEEIPYQIEIKNPTNSIIKVTKDDSKKDLMDNQKETILKRNTLKKDKKENIYYHIKIVKSNNITRDDLIYIKITN
ncbi:MAG: hypothetical protein IK137_03115 [Bacilli bacterium]|nr:hypothetical protein [Bacilli bacterium]